MTEAELMAAVIDLAHLYGWRCAHFRPAMTSKGWRTPVGADGAGFPDLLMVHLKWNQMICAELKGTGGRTTIAQETWLTSMPSWCEVHVWRPADWTDGTILAALKGTA
jgi:hypothetical protein